MKSEKLYISESTNFNNLNISKDVFKLTCYWDTDNVESFLWRIDSLVNSILDGLKVLRVLDLSNLKGIKQFIFHGTSCKSLYALYLPLSTESVIIDSSETIIDVRSMGAKSIEICDAPSLRNVEYGDGIEWLCLDNTGVSHINLSPAISLNYISFRNCKNLRTISVLNAYIGSGTFEGCENLEEVVLPNNMLVLEPFVFKNCKNLRFIKGGNSIKQLFPSAIEGCAKLEFIEGIEFIKFTDLNVSDKEWIDRKKWRNHRYFNLQDKHNIEYNINDTIKFAKTLKKRNLPSPCEYFRDNFFVSSPKKHIGILIHYNVNGRFWIIWSLNFHRYFISTNINDIIQYKHIRENIRKGRLIEFEYDDTPNIIPVDGVYLQRPIRRIDMLSVKILSVSDEYQDLIDYYSPSESFFKKYSSIEKMVDELDIFSIINSYKIETGTYWQIRPGRDDFEWDFYVAKSNYSDAYIDILLPQKDTREYSSGCAPWGAGEESARKTQQMQEQADKEAFELKKNAFEKYSKQNHICTLLEEYVKARVDLEKSVENRYNIKEITNYVKGFHLNGNEPEKLKKLYCVTLDDILKQSSPIINIWNNY